MSDRVEKWRSMVERIVKPHLVDVAYLQSEHA